jgi:hypothetical protein
MPDLLDERQCLTIERMFDADNQRLALPAADFSEIKSFRASNLHQIACIQTDRGRNRRQIDPQQLSIEGADQSRTRIAIRQYTDRNLLILLGRHVPSKSVAFAAHDMLVGSDLPALHENPLPLAQTIAPCP